MSYLFGIGGGAFGPLPSAASLAATGSYAAVLAGSVVLCLACAAAATDHGAAR